MKADSLFVDVSHGLHVTHFCTKHRRTHLKADLASRGRQLSCSFFTRKLHLK
jgi:hypothetical protein